MSETTAAEAYAEAARRAAAEPDSKFRQTLRHIAWLDMRREQGHQVFIDCFEADWDDALKEDKERYPGPCCPYANTTCVGHDWDDHDDEPTPADELLRNSLMFPASVGYRYNRPGERLDTLGGLIIESPNFCEYGNPPF